MQGLERLGACELFKTFTPEQRQELEQQLEKDPALRFKSFSAGAIACKKGEFELDLCFILGGSVELFDEVPGQGWSKVATIGVGNFYGELGAIGGLPRTTDVVAGPDGAEIFYLPRHALKFVEINAEARAVLADRYRERAVRVLAKELELFKGVPQSFIDELIPHCQIQRYETRGVMIIKQGEPGDAFYIVRDGFVQVIHERDDGTHRVLAYLRSGEYFGEMALIEHAERYASVSTAGKCELIRIGLEQFRSLCERNPEVESELRRIIAWRHEQEQKITPEISDLLERSGQLGVIQADALLVMDLDLCIKCDNCVKACESLHGKSRLTRNGIQIGKYLVPSACRHCDDPKCMNSCPTSAIKRRPEGEIYFQYDLCIGCGNCAIACPYDNIAMIETKAFDQAQAQKARFTGSDKFFRPYPLAAHDAVDAGLWERLFGAQRKTGATRRKPAPAASAEPPAHMPPAFPIKCDLCDGLPLMGCVHSCPTGAAIRIDPATLFKETGAVRLGSHVRKASGGSDPRGGEGDIQADQSNDAVERQHPAPIASISLWALAWGIVVLAAHALTSRWGIEMGSYRTGALTLAVFLVASLYSLRKRVFWISMRLLSLTMRLPRPIARRIAILDRIESWRALHVAVGVLAMLPLWWHTDVGAGPSRLEAALLAAIVLLVLSGFAGSLIEDLLPHAMRTRGDQEVRLEDVAGAIDALHVTAEEAILGHSEQLVQAYVTNLRPILTGSRSRRSLLWATLTGGDPAPAACAAARARIGSAGDDADVYRGLLEITERKVRLDLNDFNLRISTGWLTLHIGLALMVGLLVVFHVLGALYFKGI